MSTPRHVAAAGAIAVILVACGSGDDAAPTNSGPPPATDAPANDPPETDPPEADAPTTDAPTTIATPTTDAPTTMPTTTLDEVTMDEFRSDVETRCAPGASVLGGLPPNDGTIETATTQIDALRVLRDERAALPPLEAPAELSAELAEIDTLADEADAELARAEAAVAAGDVVGAEAAIDAHIDRLASTAGQFALMGAPCGIADPARAANADLNVRLQNGASQIGTGFGSVWVSEGDGGTVVRIDPERGDILARIDVGAGPLKLQSADGKMWVRSADEYVRIDPDTNTVDARLAKADVGPTANRSWALDGAMWICDGRTLHRYEPTTIEPLATIGVEIDCDNVYATSELVVVWTYNDEPDLAADPAAVMIDPATNEVLATIPLPVDVVSPAVFDDVVFFAGHETPTAVVVDRETWMVTSTPDLARATGGGGIVSDGASIFVPTDDAVVDDVLVVDAVTYEVVEVIEPLGVNHVTVLDGSLWLTDGALDVTQRFDR